MSQSKIELDLNLNMNLKWINVLEKFGDQERL